MQYTKKLIVSALIVAGIFLAGALIAAVTPAGAKFISELMLSGQLPGWLALPVFGVAVFALYATQAPRMSAVERLVAFATTSLALIAGWFALPAGVASSKTLTSFNVNTAAFFAILVIAGGAAFYFGNIKGGGEKKMSE